MVLVTGSDFRSIRAEPRPLEDFQSFLDRTTTTSTTVAADDPSSETPPTTESESFLPEPPPGVSCG
ncbi:hypothetical protein D3C84_1276520 [compost metagenome]